MKAIRQGEKDNKKERKQNTNVARQNYALQLNRQTHYHLQISLATKIIKNRIKCTNIMRHIKYLSPKIKE